MNARRNAGSAVGRALPHESAHLHVRGAAAYTDDLPEPGGLLHAAIGACRHARARLTALNLDAVLSAPGVVSVCGPRDIPGANDISPALGDEPIFAVDEVQYFGQALFAVAATDVVSARRAAKLADIDCEPLEPVLDIDTALRQEQFVVPVMVLERGDPDQALRAAPHRLRGRLTMGGQDHFYLEGQVALAIPGEDGQMQVHSSTQHPAEVQRMVGRALGLSDKDVTVHCRRMGGGFGGKETQAALFACVAALLARRSGRPVKLRLDRDADMILTGKRHDFRVDYDAGFDDRGRLLGLDIVLASRCGISADLSGPVNDRAMFHVDNCYYLSDVRITSHRCRTNTVSNTAFRGFGGPQGMLAIEQVMDDVARRLGLDAAEVRERNFYGGKGRNTTPYGMTVEDNIAPELFARLQESAAYRQRRQRVNRFNADNQVVRRGLAITPVKFGISFTATHFNQAGALVTVYTDGTVQLNHGGTEMGQGLYTKVLQVVADELGIGVEKIRCTAADTGKVPNASATAASSGSDLNAMAARNAARTIRRRLCRVAAGEGGVRPGEVRIRDGRVEAGGWSAGFPELARLAWLQRVSLSATGFYRTPRIHYDRRTLSGRPFFYFAYGAAVTEVAVDTLTGEHRVLRVDILHDAGRSLNPAVDLGQVEGGFVQGMGWLTAEELWWDEQGRLATHAPSTYKIPVCGDVPGQFNVTLLSDAVNRSPTIHRSKAVGEPPLMLAMSVFFAIRDAVASAGNGAELPRLTAPATPEAVLDAIDALRRPANRPSATAARLQP